jgi:Domain of unknown function (DUF1707)
MAEPQDDLSDPRPTETDRQLVVDQLRRHMADGRISLEEYETRTGVAYRATTADELRPLTSDLPAGPNVVPTVAPPPVGATAAGRRPPSRGADLMSIPAFRVHLFLWLVFSAFWMVIWLGSVMATSGWVPFWPVFPIAAFGLSVGIHAAVRKGLSP